MIGVSNEFRQKLTDNRQSFLNFADITLVDGTELHLENDELVMGGFIIDDAVSEDSALTSVGSAIINSATIIINNRTESYSLYNFAGAQVVLSTGLLIGSNVETLKKGTYIVDDHEYNNSNITLYLLDYMAQFDRPYSLSTLHYPATVINIVTDACLRCGVTLQTYEFPNRNIVVNSRPSDEATTFREVISWCAQIAGCFARFDVNGRLEIRWYPIDYLNNSLDGGIFDTRPASKYTTGDRANGGTFNPWTYGDKVDSGTFDTWGGNASGTMPYVHYISSLYSMNVSTDEVQITGIRILVNDDDNSVREYTDGTDDYVIEISDNPFITTNNVASILDHLARQLIGFRYRKAEITHVSDPTIEAGDVGLIDSPKGDIYKILISRTTFKAGSPQTTVSAAETPAKNSSVRFSSTSKTYVALRNRLFAEQTAREQAYANLTQAINSKAGLYTTEEVQEDGSSIFYQHDKPTLEESSVIWKMTQEALGVSTDGGRTWNAGIAINGDALVRILSAIGINAEWITSGTLRGRTIYGGSLYGGSLILGYDEREARELSYYIDENGDGFFADINEDNIDEYSGELVVKDTNGKTCLRLDRTGFYFGKYAVDNSVPLDDPLIYMDRFGFVVEEGLLGDWYFSNDGSVRSDTDTLFMFDERFVDFDKPTRIVTIGGRIVTSSGKSRLFNTRDYGERLLYAYETPTPYFGDIGDGVINDDGLCYIAIERIFSETISLNNYQVFLQKYGDGDCYVKERKPSHFVVSGTPGLEFGWEIKAKQADMDQIRLDQLRRYKK